ncbi:hypothetical protein NQZ68_018644 [Dissostichus eleginoides]|nr:hypothetical protein NQZ68_018644 [Dissostichus eleginoides]
MVLWWKRNADSLRVVLQLRISCSTMAPGLSGMGSIGMERRKLPDIQYAVLLDVNRLKTTEEAAASVPP